MKKLCTVFSIFFLTSCASPDVVQTIQISDKDLSCNQLIAVTEEIKKFEKEGREGRTVTDTNVALRCFGGLA